MVESQWTFVDESLVVRADAAAGAGAGERPSRREFILPQVPLRLRSRTGVVTARGRMPMRKW